MNGELSGTENFFHLQPFSILLKDIVNRNVLPFSIYPKKCCIGAWKQ